MASCLLLLVLLYLPCQIAGATFLGGSYPSFVAPALPRAAVSCHAIDTCGAKGDGNTDDTLALQRCIRRCSAMRDGHEFAEVVLPSGHTFLSGALNLTSRLILTISGTISLWLVCTVCVCVHGVCVCTVCVCVHGVCTRRLSVLDLVHLFQR